MSDPRWLQIQRDAGEAPVSTEPENEMDAFLFVCDVLGAEPAVTASPDNGSM